MVLNNPLLHRFWFELARGLGVGVSAYSLDEAEAMARDACLGFGWDFDVVKTVENVDVRDLDQNHVVPNMGPPNFKGVWFPMLNLEGVPR